ncbi:MAG: aldo/keto reductase [Thermodesulfobacteriota bacterium]
MKQNRLGRTGIEVSELSFGTLTFSKHHANVTIEAGARTVKKGLELGINLFDTASSYGTQDHLREGLKGAGDKVVISTKTHAKTRESAIRDLEASLRELNREYIDIYHLHLIQDDADLIARRQVLEYLLECKERGLIRAIGATLHTVKGARTAVAEQNIDILFTVLNSGGLGIRDASLEDMLEICRQADDRGMGILVMKPLGGGHLRKSPQKAFDFLRNICLVDSICVGMKSPAEVEMNVGLMEDRTPSNEILSQIETIPRRLRINDTCLGCGACIETCAQGALSMDWSKADPSEGKQGQARVDNDQCILCGYCADACPQFSIRVV